MRSDLVDIEVWKVDEREKAWAFADPNRRRHSAWIWVPKSQAEFEETGPKGKGTLTLPEWLAKEKDLI